jgi:heme O synthase-like polyprenyltransferase
VFIPLKNNDLLSVLLEFLPGAISVYVGWVAPWQNSEPVITYFAIQFWQFYILAIDGFCTEDYEKAGFFMLPGKDKGTALGDYFYIRFITL